MMMTMRTEDLLQLDLGGSFRETFVMRCDVRILEDSI